MSPRSRPSQRGRIEDATRTRQNLICPRLSQRLHQPASENWDRQIMLHQRHHLGRHVIVQTCRRCPTFAPPPHTCDNDVVSTRGHRPPSAVVQPVCFGDICLGLSWILIASGGPGLGKGSSLAVPHPVIYTASRYVDGCWTMRRTSHAAYQGLDSPRGEPTQ